jgi:glycosyltransferase involved in cell wall biosynthesis
MDASSSQALWVVFMPTKTIRVLQVGMSDNYGGTEAVVYGIYQHLDHSQIQFDFLNVYGHPIAKQAELEAQGAHVYDLLLKRREGYFKYIRGIKAFYKIHASEFNAVVCNIQCMDQIDMAKWAKQFHIPTRIIFCHNSGSGLPLSRLSRLATSLNRVQAHRYATQFLAVSQLAAQATLSPKDAKRCLIFKTGISTDHFCFSPTKRLRFREEFGYSSEDLLFGSAGRFDPQKNQFFLLSIFAAIRQLEPRAKFVLAGKGDLEQPLRKRALELGIEDSIRFITNLDDLDAMYCGIDCFLFPSLFEGLGMVLLEAQCSGLACLASSEKIPVETKILSSFIFLSLKDDPQIWAKRAIESVSSAYKREDGASALSDNGRDIQTVAKAYASLFLKAK